MFVDSNANVGQYSVTVSNGSVNISNTTNHWVNFIQKMELFLLDILENNIVTFSIIYNNYKNVLTKTFEFVTLQEIILTSNIILYLYKNGTNSIDLQIRLSPGFSININAVKLEIGNKQTLCYLDGDTYRLNEIPVYENELLRCQAYMINLNGLYQNNNQLYISNSSIFDKTHLLAYIPLPTTLKKKPTLQSNIPIGNITCFGIFSDSNNITNKLNTITSINNFVICNNSIVQMLYVNTNNTFINGNRYLVWVNLEAQYFYILDANL